MKKSITLKSLLIIFLCNAAFIALYFFLLMHVFSGVNKWVEPFPALENLHQFMKTAKSSAIPILFGAGAGFSIISWLLVSFFGNKTINQAGGKSSAAVDPKQAKKDKKQTLDELKQAQPSIRASLQLLVILQRQGRLVDFLQEDLSQFDDAQIGAAARNIHSSCRDSIKKHIKLEPIFKNEEGEEISIPEGFDAQAIQLTGNVKGNPPFRGVLKHKGWRASNIQLPKLAPNEDNNNVLAPAEVEIA